MTSFDLSRSIPRTISGRSAAGPHRPGDVVHGCELREKLGEGGFGEAWLADDEDGHPIVLKFPTALAGAKALAALRREAEVFERLTENVRGAAPPIVPILRDLLDRDPPALAMEYMGGGDLRRYMRAQGGPVPVASTNKIVGDILRALAFAHRRGVAHRDLSPENVLFDNNEYRWKVADFGLARVAIDQELSLERSARTAEASKAIAGKLHYMAPEAAAGDAAATTPADIYALGVIWAQMLTGDGDSGLPAHWQSEIADEASREQVARCLLRGPSKRPTATALLEEGPGGRLETKETAGRRLLLAAVGIFVAIILVVLLAALADKAFIERSYRATGAAKPTNPVRRSPPSAKEEASQGVSLRNVRDPDLAWSTKDGGVVAAPWSAGTEAGERRSLALPDGGELAFRWVPDVGAGPGFWIAETETTVALWSTFARMTNYDSRPREDLSADRRRRPAFYPILSTWRGPGFAQSDAHPVVSVSASEAELFCGWLSNQTGLRIALPTVTQWLSAAEFSRLPAGRLEQIAAWARFYVVGASDAGTAPVGSLARDALGLFDLAGNAAEWCLSDRGKMDGLRAAKMGGSWRSSRLAKWSDPRKDYDDGEIANTTGFRVVVLTREAGRE